MDHVIRSTKAGVIIACLCLALASSKSRADNTNTTAATSFTFQAKLIANDGTAESSFGGAVAISGDTAVVGALVNNGNNGIFYVFVRSGNTWTQQAKLIPSDGVDVSYHSGLSAAISGDTVVINGPAATINSNPNQGAAYVFIRNGTTWTEQQRLTASDGAAQDQFGSNVSINGDSIIVGAEYDDIGSNTDQGSAYIYVRQGGAWTEQAKLVANDGAANGLLGYRVSISGDTAAVSSSNFSISSVSHAYVFFRSGTNWSQQANVSVCEPHSPHVPCRISSLAVNGDTLIFGDMGVNVGNNTFQGAAYVFIRSGTTWSLQQRLTASDGQTNDAFGRVAIEGNTVVVGASATYVFTRSGNIWTEQQKLLVSSSGVSISGNTILVGDTSDTINGNTRQGSVSVFVAPVVGSATQAEVKTWTIQGRTYAYVKLSFPNAGYRVADWGQAVRSVNDFTADATVEKLTGASVQSVTTTAQIYDLGPLADGNYTFTFKDSGTMVKSQAFIVSSAIPPPNPIDDQRQFVRQQYLDFLNREPDGPGWDFWTDNITKCGDPARRPPGQTEAQCTLQQRETTSGAFFLSPEFQYTGYYVYRMYQGALGRQPKLSEFTPDAQFVGAGILVNSQLSAAKINQNKADFAQQFVNCTDPAKFRCAEFKAIYDGLNNQQYVDKLFLTTGVNASVADRAALVNGLNANPVTETRASVLQKVVDGIVVIAEGNQQFTTSYGQAFYNAEFNRAFVQLQYFGYMKRDPDDAGYAFWLGKLNQFGGNFVNAEMVLAFISSPEYRARFGQP